MKDIEKHPAAAAQEPVSFVQEWNIVPKQLFLTLNLMIYATHALETTFYVNELGFKEWEVGVLNCVQFVPFLVGIGLGNLADRFGAHREMALYLTSIYCLVNTITSLKELIAGNLYVMMGIRILASCCSGAIFPFVDAMVVSMLAQRGAFSKDLFGSQRMFGSVGHLLATSLSIRFNYYLISHDAMFFLLNISGLLFMLVVLIGIPADLKIEKGAGHHHHAPPANKGVLSAPSPVPTSTPSPSPVTHEQNAETCQKVAVVVQLQTSSTPVPPPIQMPSASPVFRLLSSIEFLAFLAFILSAGYSRSVMNIFQKHYIIGVQKMSDSNLDFMEAFRTGSEMAIYYFSRYFIAFLGPHWVLLISQASGLVRMLIYSFYGKMFDPDPTKNIWVVQTGTIMFGELMKGLNTGMMMSCAIKVANEMAPSGCEASAQSLLSGFYNALGLTVGGVVSGIILYLKVDSKPAEALETMFIFSSAVTALFIVMFFLKFTFIDKALFRGRE